MPAGRAGGIALSVFEQAADHGHDLLGHSNKGLFGGFALPPFALLEGVQFPDMLEGGQRGYVQGVTDHHKLVLFRPGFVSIPGEYTTHSPLSDG